MEKQITTTHNLSKEDLLDRFNFWLGLFGFTVEKGDRTTPAEYTFAHYTCYHEDTDTYVDVGLDLEDFARVVKVLKPWEQMDEKEYGIITSIETNSVN